MRKAVIDGNVAQVERSRETEMPKGMQMQVDEVGAYDFTSDEPAVVLIEMLPHRFVMINGTNYALEKEIILKDDKLIKVWTTEPNGRLWIPGRLVDPLTLKQGKDKQTDNLPMAQVICSRTEKQWKDNVDPLADLDEDKVATPKRREVPES